MRQQKLNKVINIVIVDDHKMLRQSLKSNLDRDESINIIADYSGGDELLNKIKSLKVDIILLDVTMPGISGLETIKELRNRNFDTKVIALSMHDDNYIITDMIKAGVNGYVLKDCSFVELLKAIHLVYEGKMYLCNRTKQIVIDNYTRDVQNSENQIENLLTAREKEILSYITSGLSNKEIAKKLFISIRTVETHRLNLKKKLKISSTVDLIKFAISQPSSLN